MEIEFLGAPLEEHGFIVVVPAMVVGTHESLRRYLDEDADSQETPVLHLSSRNPVRAFDAGN